MSPETLTTLRDQAEQRATQLLAVDRELAALRRRLRDLPVLYQIQGLLRQELDALVREILRQVRAHQKTIPP